MMKDIISLTKNDLKNYNDYSNSITKYNTNLTRLRQHHLLMALKESTDTRIEIIGKIRNWINILEKRIFNPDLIDQMDINKVIALFKFVGSFSLKMLGQMNDIETIFKAYTESSSALQSIRNCQNAGKKDKNEVDKLKKEILQGFMTNFKENIDDASIVQKDKDEKTSIELSGNIDKLAERKEDIEINDEKIIQDDINLDEIDKILK